MSPAATEEKYQPERSKTRSMSSRSDLSASGPRPYPAKLLALYETPGDFGAQMYLEFERPDEDYADGNPAIDRKWLSLEINGEPIWEGSDTDQFAVSFEDATGVDFFSEEAETLEGTFFMLIDTKTDRTKKKNDKPIYVTTIMENLGTDYVFAGKKRVRPSRDDNGASPAESTEMSEADAAMYVANLFNGHAVATLKEGVALNLVKNDETLADVKNLFGKTLRGACVAPRAVLVDLLIENGYAVEEAGVFTSHPDDIPFE